jgi:hypothetical protein
MIHLLQLNIKFHQATMQLHQKHIDDLHAIANLQETIEDKEAVETDMITDGLNDTEEYPEFADMNNIWDRIHAAHTHGVKETSSKENNLEELADTSPVESTAPIQSDMKPPINTPLPEINDKKYPSLNSLMKYGPREQQRIQMNIFQQAVDNIDSVIRVNPNEVPNKDDATSKEADRLLQVWLTTH